jgi:hypothetical protein
LQNGEEQLALQDGVEQLDGLNAIEDDAGSVCQGVLVEAGVNSAVGMKNFELQASGEFKRFGELGKHHGIKGAEYGRLGGRPRKNRVESQVIHMQRVVLSKSNRKELSIKPKRDDSFGIMARLEVAKLVHKLLPVVEQQGGSLDDVFTYLADHTNRPKAKIKWAFENEGLWQKLKLENKIGGACATLKTTKGLRTPGGGATAQLSELYPTLRIWFERQRSNGNFVDLEMLVLEFEHLMRVSLNGL